MKVVVLAGGVGGAKLVHGLAMVHPPEDLTAIVNTGDDFQHLGLHVSPDLDTVMYTLAGLANPETGWGIAGDSFACLESLEALGGPAWFRLGDRDIATHLQRTALMSSGLRLTEVTAVLARALGVAATILPMTDARVATRVKTADGELNFQDYFVRLACEPRVTGFRFEGSETALPSPEVIGALEQTDVVLIAPSNPFVSIEPIFSLPGVREAIALKPSAAVSPIIGGRALKGPAGKMFAELGLEVAAVSVAARYKDVVGGVVLDQEDEALVPEVEALGLACRVSQTIMLSDDHRADLAREALVFVAGLKARAGP